MKRHRILYLFIALALLLAPMAAYAAPMPADFHSTPASAANPQPSAPIGGANRSRGGVQLGRGFDQGFVGVCLVKADPAREDFADGDGIQAGAGGNGAMPDTTPGARGEGGGGHDLPPVERRRSASCSVITSSRRSAQAHINP